MSFALLSFALLSGYPQLRSRVLCEKVRESVRLQVVVLCQLGRPQCYTSAGMASGERKQTDVESDEEFEEMTSDDLFTFYFGDKVEDVYDALTLQLSKKRLDRVEKILEILAADQSRAYSLQNALEAILWEAFKHMPIGDCSELLQIIFRHGGEGFRSPRADGKGARFAVTQAVLYRDDNSLDTLREFLGNRFVRLLAAEEQKKIHSQSELFSASLRGDVAEVERLLARISTLPENDLSRFLGFNPIPTRGGGTLCPPQVHFLKYLRNALSYGLETF